MKNSVDLLGHLSKDPLLFENDTKVGILTVAVHRKYRDPNTKKPITDFVQVKTFGKLAENCCKYLTSGSQVQIDAEVRPTSYEKDGKREYTQEIVATEVRFLSKTKQKENQNTKPNGQNNDDNYPSDDYDPFPGATEEPAGEWPFG